MTAIDGLIAKVGSIEIAALKRDAFRYRWLREQHWKNKTLVVTKADQLVKFAKVLPGNGQGFDEAIDAAIESYNAELCGGTSATNALLDRDNL